MPLHNSKNILVTLSDVCFSFGNKPILQRLNMEIAEDDFVVITGANGEGKTTLLRVLLKLVKAESGLVHYYEKGEEVKSLHIGYLPQKNAIDSSFPITVREIVMSGIYGASLCRNVTPDEVAQVDAMLDILQLRHLSHRSVGELSGGELQRTLLGRAIISQPKLLVLDEPLSYIDEDFTQNVCDLLQRLAHTTTVVMVTHHPHIVEKMATKKFKLIGGNISM